MGVRGYDLLELANQKGIPALMLTAHALSPNNLVKSIKGGAQSYVPKDKMADIVEYLAEVLKARAKGKPEPTGWFSRLAPFFDRKFGAGWKDQEKEFWDKFEKESRVKREELEDML
jgi:DNA-binding NarL/FixJ family response regulator